MSAIVADVSDTLYRQLAADEARLDFVIEFRVRADLSAAFAMAWNERGRYVHERLRATAESSQAAARSMLTARGIQFESHWIKNVVVVRQGDLGALLAAGALDEVSRVQEMPDAELIKPERSVQAKKASAAGGISDNIVQARAPEAWALGTTGNGVTVGIIDSGSHCTHPAFINHYRGNQGGVIDHNYNWFSPGFVSPEPFEASARGTHVVGIVVGDDLNIDPSLRNRVGVAPGPQWMTCLGFPEHPEQGQDALLGCGEFMLAPTRTDGTLPNPDKRPQVVKNSWGELNCDGTATPYYADMIEAWVAAGISPVFAVGNSSNCHLS